MSTLPQSGHRGLQRFAAGFAVGAAAIPFTLALRVGLGTSGVLAWYLFCVLCAGAVALRPHRAGRATGLAAGLAATVLAHHLPFA